MDRLSLTRDIQSDAGQADHLDASRRRATASHGKPVGRSPYCLRWEPARRHQRLRVMDDPDAHLPRGREVYDYGLALC